MLHTDLRPITVLLAALVMWLHRIIVIRQT
jgi:hypothetical protein